MIIYYGGGVRELHYKLIKQVGVNKVLFTYIELDKLLPIDAKAHNQPEAEHVWQDVIKGKNKIFLDSGAFTIYRKKVAREWKELKAKYGNLL